MRGEHFPRSGNAKGRGWVLVCAVAEFAAKQTLDGLALASRSDIRPQVDSDL